jgi:hypothetical protein
MMDASKGPNEVEDGRYVMKIHVLLQTWLFGAFTCDFETEYNLAGVQCHQSTCAVVVICLSTLDKVDTSTLEHPNKLSHCRNNNTACQSQHRTRAISPIAVDTIIDTRMSNCTAKHAYTP